MNCGCGGRGKWKFSKFVVVLVKCVCGRGGRGEGDAGKTGVLLTPGLYSGLHHPNPQHPGECVRAGGSEGGSGIGSGRVEWLGDVAGGECIMRA